MNCIIFGACGGFCVCVYFGLCAGVWYSCWCYLLFGVSSLWGRFLVFRLSCWCLLVLIKILGRWAIFWLQTSHVG